VEGRYHPLISNVGKRTETSSNIRRPRRRGGREGKKEGRKGADRIETAVPEVWTSAPHARLPYVFLVMRMARGRIVPIRCCWWKEMCKPMDCRLDGVGGRYTSSAAALEMGGWSKTVPIAGSRRPMGFVVEFDFIDIPVTN
jgi:hypothetical protein